MIILVRLRADRFKGLRAIDLAFPQQGSVLIEGHNEAGKSTLFEAIYAAFYGKALIGEDESRPRLDDLITFDESSAWVELTFATNTAQLRVRRDFTRGKGQTASVTVMHPDAADETRHGTSAVNERVLRELGNLDGDTLRNSCFVEQKELGRLESLSRGERERAIDHLLGLERLTKLAEHYRQDGKDALKQLTRAEQLAELAQAQAVAATMDETIASTRDEIDAMQAQQWLADLAALTTQAQAIADQRAQTTARIAALEERITRAQQIAAWLQVQASLARDITQVQALRATIAMSASERQARRDAIRTHDIPAAQQQMVQVNAAQLALQSCDAAWQAWEAARRGATDAQAQQVVAENAQAELAAANVAVVAAEADVATTAAAAQAATQQQHDAEVSDALDGWLRIAATVASVSDFGEREQQLHAAYTAAKGETDTSKLHAQRMAIVMGCCLALAGAGVTVAILTHIYLLVATLIATLVIIPAMAANRTYQSARIILHQAETTWHEAQAQNEGARRAGADPALLAKQRALLTQLGVADDLTLAAGQRLQADLARRLTTAVPTAREAAQQARDAATAAAARATAARQQRDMLVAKLAPTMAAPQAASDMVLAARQAEQSWQSAVANAQVALTAAGLAADADMLIVVAAQTRLAQHLTQLEQEATAAGEDASTRQAELDAQVAAILLTWEEVATTAQSLRLAAPVSTADATMLPETALAAQLEHLGAVARAENARLDSPGAQSQRDALNGQIGEQRQQSEQLAQQQADRRDILIPLLVRHAIMLPPVGPIDHALLTRQWPLLAQVTTTDLPALERRIGDAENRRFAAQTRTQQLATTLALPPATVAALDVAGSMAEVARLKQQLEIGRRAIEVINVARLRVVRQVLPTTERNMRVILPLLTAGRYHDVRLTAPEAPDGELGEVDYRIRVWDATARRYVGKAIFSGGARDQCSLALRLAFALATLPQELGIAPGFLFLDEPLSAFDGERAGALVHLLTQGHIARAFAQVFVISHQHAFAREDFRYHVRMERGRVVASDLPTARELPALIAQ